MSYRQWMIVTVFAIALVMLVLMTSCRMTFSYVSAEGDVIVEQLQEAGQSGNAGDLRGNKVEADIVP